MSRYPYYNILTPYGEGVIVLKFPYVVGKRHPTHCPIKCGHMHILYVSFWHILNSRALFTCYVSTLSPLTPDLLQGILCRLYIYKFLTCFHHKLQKVCDGFFLFGGVQVFSVTSLRAFFQHIDG